MRISFLASVPLVALALVSTAGGTEVNLGNGALVVSVNPGGSGAPVDQVVGVGSNVLPIDSTARLVCQTSSCALITSIEGTPGATVFAGCLWTFIQTCDVWVISGDKAVLHETGVDYGDVVAYTCAVVVNGPGNNVGDCYGLEVVQSGSTCAYLWEYNAGSPSRVQLACVSP